MTKDTARRAVEKAVGSLVMCMEGISGRAHTAQTDETSDAGSGNKDSGTANEAPTMRRR